jgi:large subunit ribosomal protein L21
MYAIVDIAGKQYKVEKDKYLYTDHLQAEEGETISFDKVLLLDINGAVSVGLPTVAGAKVSGKVLEHVRGDKVLVFKKKRRKGYRKLNGHRQEYTKVLIENISK